MKQFNLSEWLKDKSRKVTTRLGNREVRIICWNRKNNDNRPIITLMIDPDGNEYTTFHTENGFVDNKEKYIDKRDLFFADEERELTEFEKELNRIVTAFSATHAHMDENEIHHYSKGLLDLARKEIEKSIEEGTIEFAKSYMEDVNPSFEKVKEYEEFWKWKMSCLRGINKAYTQGKKDALKDLPKWKKATEDKEFDRRVLLLEDDKVVIATCVFKDEYYIELNDLRTLPKEE